MMIRRFGRRVFVPALCLPVVAFYAHHALVDEHGLRRLLSLQEEVAAQRATLIVERSKAEALKAEVGALGGETIDRDLLDEQARIRLGLARPDEIIIFKPKP